MATNKFLQQLMRTYGGAAADTLGGLADLPNTAWNAWMSAAGRPERLQTGQLQSRFPQPEGSVR